MDRLIPESEMRAKVQAGLEVKASKSHQFGERSEASDVDKTII